MNSQAAAVAVDAAPSSPPPSPPIRRKRRTPRPLSLVQASGSSAGVRRAESSFELRNNAPPLSPSSRPTSPAYSTSRRRVSEADARLVTTPTSSTYTPGSASPRRSSFQYHRSSSWNRDFNDTLLQTRPSLTKLAQQRAAAHPRGQSDATEETLTTPTTSASSASAVTPRFGPSASTHLQTPFGSQGSLYMLAERHAERNDTDESGVGEATNAPRAVQHSPDLTSQSGSNSAQDSFHTGAEQMDVQKSKFVEEEPHKTIASARPISQASQRSITHLTPGPSNERLCRRRSRENLESRGSAEDGYADLDSLKPWAASWSESPLSFFTPLPPSQRTFPQLDERAEDEARGQETPRRRGTENDVAQREDRTSADTGQRKSLTVRRTPTRTRSAQTRTQVAPQSRSTVRLTAAKEEATPPVSSRPSRLSIAAFVASSALTTIPLSGCPALFYVFEASYLATNLSPAVIYAPIPLFVASWASFFVWRRQCYQAMSSAQLTCFDLEKSSAPTAPTVPATPAATRPVMSGRQESVAGGDEDDDPAIAALDDDSPKRKLALARLKEQLMRRTMIRPASSRSDADGVMSKAAESEPSAPFYSGGATDAPLSQSDSAPTGSTQPLASPPLPPPPPQPSPALTLSTRPSFGASGRGLWGMVEPQSQAEPQSEPRTPVGSMAVLEIPSSKAIPGAAPRSDRPRHLPSTLIFLGFGALSSAYCVALSVWLIIHRGGSVTQDTRAIGTLTLVVLAGVCFVAVCIAMAALIVCALRRSRDKE